ALAVIEATRLGDLYLEALREGAPLPPAMARRAELVAQARRASNPQEIVKSIVAVYRATRGSPLFPTLARASAARLPDPAAQTAIRHCRATGHARLPAPGRQEAGTGLDAACPQRRLQRLVGPDRARAAAATRRHRGHRRPQAVAAQRGQSLVLGPAGE